MPETDDTSQMGSEASDTPDGEIGTVEDENGGATEIEPDLLDPKRHRDLTAWATKLATENKELRSAVTQILQRQNGPAPAQDAEQQAVAEAERLLKERGAAGLLELQNKAIMQAYAPLYQKMQRLETMLSEPDYRELEGRVNDILQETQSGNVNIDKLLLRLARAEAVAEKANKGISPRKPDDPRRGASTGNRGGSLPQASPVPNLDELDGTAVAKLALKDPTTTPGIREWIYEQHPELRPKG